MPHGRLERGCSRPGRGAVIRLLRQARPSCARNQAAPEGRAQRILLGGAGRRRMLFGNFLSGTARLSKGWPGQSRPAIVRPGRLRQAIAAILVADVVGYSRLTGADEERTLARLRGLRTDLVDLWIKLAFAPGRGQEIAFKLLRG